MSLIQIAWRNFCHRSLSSSLTTLSLALGVGLVVLVLSIFGIISEAFSRNASVGYNLVVGPKGSALQLTLNSVYYLSQPIENLPFTEYMEFFSKPERAEMVRRYGGDPKLGERDGEYVGFVAGGYAIPLALGDYYGEFRAVGTTTDFFEKLRHGPNVDEPFTFKEGRAFKAFTQENGYFEAVLGSRVASEMGMHAGDVFYPTHGDPEGKGHGQGFKIVGILDPTGTPNDRATFVNLEGFYLLNNHSKPLTGDEVIVENDDWKQLDPEHKPLSIPQREVTSILVRNGNLMFAPGMQNKINEGLQAQAAAPVGEIAKLMTAIVGPLLKALLAITLITCVVAAVGVLVAIYNSMNDRRRDIAVMRALGARRDTVTTIILAESLIIALIGGVLGWFLAHFAIWCASGYIEEQTGVQATMFTTSTYELAVLPLVIALALLAGFLPAWSAYRTDVGSNLAA
ncbi:ABC transporter permease [Novipirellula artificiosorum]|uniref:Cell division ABC transporter subunit FtsX n=1 Tax=Novipirellula artificiosorum TaxID=2528016 RepID=A0A5C6DAQ4_9BACT|nr:FtsX-like permease family protein [Novipirellula artificiosorum]TWU32807.1 cell division ABC transporter subunit FtsX [Novipirellula artificiosorum]